MTRSLAAVVAGFILVAVLSAAADAFCRTTGAAAAPGFPTSAMLVVLAAAYRHVFQAIGGYVTAQLAPRAPRYHVALLGLVDLVLSMQA